MQGYTALVRIIETITGTVGALGDHKHAPQHPSMRSPLKPEERHMLFYLTGKNRVSCGSKPILGPERASCEILSKHSTQSKPNRTNGLQLYTVFLVSGIPKPVLSSFQGRKYDSNVIQES